ncbi:MAG: ATP-grasp domain-containing protein [Sphingomonadaceae bacterium]|nr:ATP-grasp domain-containing protein [Sphingomonadaceae bacterium]
MDTNIARLEDRLLIISRKVGVPTYDFDFEKNFSCAHPFRFDEAELVILRIGAIPSYEQEYSTYAAEGVRLVNSPQEHFRASELEGWYPLISDITPATEVYEVLPSVTEIEKKFDWPVFVKGSRQTSKHNPALAVARNSSEYLKICEAYGRDPILHWQRPVVRQFIELDAISGFVPNKISPSREFRTFWWNGNLVGCGHYWYQLPSYGAPDLDVGLGVARKACQRVSVPFLVVDIAKTSDGDWLVIECNDAQEAGYVGLSPLVLWRNILELI